MQCCFSASGSVGTMSDRDHSAGIPPGMASECFIMTFRIVCPIVSAATLQTPPRALENDARNSQKVRCFHLFERREPVRFPIGFHGLQYGQAFLKRWFAANDSGSKPCRIAD